jgi:tetratricopeptide (TPR) repeat protein
MVDATDALRQALASLRAGRAAEAEATLRELLRLQPTQAGARQLLGIVLLELGRPAPALLELDAAAPALAASPALHYNRGNALAALGRLEEAALAYAQACALKPDLAEAQFNAGNVLRALGRRNAALAAFERARAAAPTLAAAHAAAGSLLLELERDELALAAFDRALELDPAQWLTHNRRGIALHRLGRVELALAAFDAALALQPQAAEAWNNRGNALHDLRRLQAALECFQRALQLQPEFPEATGNLGMALQDLRRLDEAQAAYERAIALRPRHAEAYRRRASLRLLRGEFAAGWADFETAHELAMADAPPGLPWWRGEALAGKSILLSEPNGIGDTLQFIRFAPKLLAQGARVAFAGPPRFRRLLADFDQRIDFVDEQSRAGFDYRCWLWSLPHWLGVGGEVAAERDPYLHADPQRVARWAQVFDDAFIHVGVCWQGNPARRIDRGRSAPLAQFLPLARVPGVKLWNLQKNFGLEQLQALPEGMQVHELGPDFDEGEHAFLDSAAVLQHLDLLVSVDSSLTHLAGALGRPAWLALNPVPDWRWQLDRADSPWYPHVRLFRQAPDGGWEGVFAAMAAELAAAAPALRAARSR